MSGSADWGNGPANPLIHHGTAGPALRLGLTNLLLNVATLFFWRFWARTRVRRLLWSQTTAWGEPLEYTGTGKELFLGFLVVFALVFVPLMAGFSLANVLIKATNPLGALLAMALQTLVFLLAAAGLYRARRYQLSRTLWRGIRGGLGGKAWTYGLMAMGITFGSGVTLGWLWPQAEVLLACYRIRHTTFGDRSFSCDERGMAPYKRFAALWFGTVLLIFGMVVLAAVTAASAKSSPHSDQIMQGVFMAALVFAIVAFAFLWAWYKAAFYRNLAAGTRFGEVRFQADIHAWPLLRLALGNLLLTVLTLGIGRPLAASRTFRFACQRLTVIGTPDFADIHQSALARPKLGEGLAAVFDGVGEF